MIMKLNCSNAEVKIFLKVNIKLCILFFFTISLNSCGLYEYQPPAPIYGTNPYENRPYNSAKVYKKSGSDSLVSKKNKVVQINSAKPGFAEATPTSVKPMSPAVLALVTEANKNSKAGDLESAVATIERALRIDARNPRLTYKLAELRLKQSKPRLAEDLARKAALLSAHDRVLKKQSWLLISEARRRQKNYHGAKEAKLKANNI